MKVAETDSPKQQYDNLTSSTGDKQESLAQNSLSVNKRFVVNTLKQVDDHNRYTINVNSKLLRKFQNEERKKHTVKNLKRFSAQKTLYSDFFGAKNNRPFGRTKIRTPLEQVRKLISDAVVLDGEQEENMLNRVVRKSRVNLDKRLLNNHLKHYSVHNRLVEENEMWEKHKSQKQRKQVGLQTKSARRTRYGGMYADREPGSVQITRVKPTPDEIRPIGSATRKLLQLKESMPDKWSHSGFKETYARELNDLDEINLAESSSNRKIVISSIRDRLNNSIELSDDDIEIVPARKLARKLGSRVVVNKLKRKRTHTPKELICIDAVPSKKKSIVKLVPKSSKVIKPLRNKVKAPVVNKIKRNTLQADLIMKEARNKKNIKRTASPKWGHDGFQEINVDESEGSRRGAKGRLRTIELDNEEDSEVSIDFPKLNVTNDKVSQANKTKKDVSDRLNNSEDSIPPSESDEWTEKDVVDKLAENDARRKLKKNKEDGTGVNRVTLKNSIHKGKGDSIKDRLTLPPHLSSKSGSNKGTVNGNKRETTSRSGNKRETSSRNDGRRSTDKHDDDSSLTDSSSDERFQRRISDKRQRVMRDRRFYNNRGNRR